MADVDPDVPVAQAPVPALLAVVAAGGVLGSLSRYGLTVAHPGLLTTMLINVSGSFLLGLLAGLRPQSRWSRPFFGTGVLGGFTTMSAFAVQLVEAPVGTAFGYAAGTLLFGLGAAELGRRVAR